MYIDYRDIRSRIADRPSWWLRGVPRYEPFQPDDVGVYTREVALVHTECQSCGMRYDVAVEPPPRGGDLRSSIAYENALPIGDPPNACPDELGCPGASMSSVQIEVLEFWRRPDIREWQRESEWERALADGPWDISGKEAGLVRIMASGRKEDWFRAVNAGDFEAMVAILTAVGSERAAEIADMVDLQRRDEAFLRDLYALHRQRAGGA